MSAHRATRFEPPIRKDRGSKNVTFANNLIASARTSVVAPGVGLLTPNIFGNLYIGAPLGFTPDAGFTASDPLLARAADGLMRPSSGSALGVSSKAPTCRTKLWRRLNESRASFSSGA